MKKRKKGISSKRKNMLKNVLNWQRACCILGFKNGQCVWNRVSECVIDKENVWRDRQRPDFVHYFYAMFRVWLLSSLSLKPFRGFKKRSEAIQVTFWKTHSGYQLKKKKTNWRGPYLATLRIRIYGRSTGKELKFIFGWW